MDGIALMHLKIFRPPGRFRLSFQVAGYPDIPAAVIPVQVLECAVGDVLASSGDACITCVLGSYSMDPRNTACDPCPPNAGEGHLYFGACCWMSWSSGHSFDCSWVKLVGMEP